MDNQRRAEEILKRLEAEYPEVEGTELHHDNPLELLVATMLSAQATDEQINKITPALFKKYKTARDYANAPREELEQDIRSSGFYKRKAEALQSMAQTIVDDYGGEVPDTMEELVKLKGVARKTANIVLSGAFDKIEGIAVDTHVDRLSHRMGLTEQKNRDKVEQDLMSLFPHEKWWAVNYLLITHGRRVCDAKKALCSECTLSDICPSAFTFKHNKKD
ncbi:MAG: endonuclease III [Candidatus Bathyarchaeota archaeon]|nr:endonuclease III [Candidatus Bathyarchaeota archaeon]